MPKLSQKVSNVKTSRSATLALALAYASAWAGCPRAATPHKQPFSSQYRRYLFEIGQESVPKNNVKNHSQQCHHFSRHNGCDGETDSLVGLGDAIYVSSYWLIIHWHLILNIIGIISWRRTFQSADRMQISPYVTRTCFLGVWSISRRIAQIPWKNI